MEEDQERYVDDALKQVKAAAYQIHNAIERNQMRACLRETAGMLLELKSTILSPRSYYNVYSNIFDEMQYVYNFFKEEARRGRRMKSLYATVEEASNIIPRLYLMITAGIVYIETQQHMSKEISNDLLSMIKGVQSPTRGLFIRYYLLKMIKDKLPDEGNDYCQGGASVKDSISFIMQNLEEMNRLWIRLSTGTVGSEKTLRENERSELRILVGENIVRLSCLAGLDLNMYQNEILPKIIGILLETKDRLSQQYLMECLIQAFPDEYNIQCISSILNVFGQLEDDVDIIGLLITLMDKLAKYVKDSGKDKEEIMSATERIFDSLKSSIDLRTEAGIRMGVSEPNKLIELQYVFMKFSINSCPQKDKLDTINHILLNTMNVLASYNKRLSPEAGTLLRNLLSVPLESELSLFDLQKFPELMVYLEFSSRVTLSIRIIESLSNKEKLDSTEKVNILLGFIRPLLEDSADTIEEEESQFEYEQNIVSKILFVISTNDPLKLLDILIAIIPIFTKGGVRRIKYTLPTLVNAFINLAYEVCLSYANKTGQLDTSNNTGIHHDYINYLDMSAFESLDVYEKYLDKIHQYLNQIISSLNQNFPLISYKLYLSAALQANSITISGDKFAEHLRGYLTGAMSIFTDNETIEPRQKVGMLQNFMGTLMQISNIANDVMAGFVDMCFKQGMAMKRRAEQVHSMLICSDLYYLLLKDYNQATICLAKAKRSCQYAMTNPENLILFVEMLNKYIYFIENARDDNILVKIEEVNDCIEIIKNHIETIKFEGSDQSFLPSIERFFADTLNIIKLRKEQKPQSFYEAIEI